MDGKSISDIQEFVIRERQLCLSDREWKHRLRGYGYGIRDTDEGQVVVSIIRGSELFTIGSTAA